MTVMEHQSDDKTQSFCAVHFGTDLLCAAWLFLISSIFYYVVMAYKVASMDFNATAPVNACNYICLLISSILYTVTSILAVIVSYPTVYRKALSDSLVVDLRKMSFMELYFTGNIFLVASWLLLIGTLPLLIYPLWGLAIGFLPLVHGIIYFLFTLITNLLLVLGVIACFPANLIKNIHGTGTTVIFDFFATRLGCCREKQSVSLCGGEIRCAAHLSKDHQIALWVIFIFSVFGLSGGIFYIFLHVSSTVAWLLLASWATFVAGSYLYAIETYSEKENSTICYDLLTCGSVKTKGALSEDMTHGSERIPLIAPENMRSV